MDRLKETYMTPMAERVIRELIKRKREEKKRERLVLIAGWMAAALFALLLLLVLSMGQSIIGSVNIRMFLSSSYGLILIALCIGTSAFLIIEKKKLEKAEEDYTELRNEVVERYEEIWNTEALRAHSYILYEWLDKEHDVNLFHR